MVAEELQEKLKEIDILDLSNVAFGGKVDKYGYEVIEEAKSVLKERLLKERPEYDTALLCQIEKNTRATKKAMYFFVVLTLISICVSAYAFFIFLPMFFRR